MPVDGGRLDPRGGAVMEALPIPTQETEVLAKPTRRRFTAEEKRRILRLADECAPGQQGALLRKEGIYSSTLAGWRAARARGELDALTPKRRGPKAAVVDPRDAQIADLSRALAKSEARARHAEALVELQKKVADLLGVQLPKTDETPS
jgi:transposase-like protein